MKRFLPLVALLPMSLFTTAAQMGSARAVYLLPMAGGIDQYLANWLTKEHVFQVTADPNAADLVMTDRLSRSVEQKLEDMHPKDSDPDTDETQRTFRGGPSRGTIFLLDAKTRNVVWSEYRKPGATSPASLNRQARNLALKLRQSLVK